MIRQPLTHLVKHLIDRRVSQTGMEMGYGIVSARRLGASGATYDVDMRGTTGQGLTTTGADFEPGQRINWIKQGRIASTPQITGRVPSNKRATQSEQMSEGDITDAILM